jgi:hypothetical protein
MEFVVLLVEDTSWSNGHIIPLFARREQPFAMQAPRKGERQPSMCCCMAMRRRPSGFIVDRDRQNRDLTDWNEMFD